MAPSLAYISFRGNLLAKLRLELQNACPLVGRECVDLLGRELQHLHQQLPLLLDILTQMKSLAASSPEQARALLGGNPQLTYALFQAMLMMNVVDPAVVQRVLSSSGGMPPPPGPGMPGPPPAGMPGPGGMPPPPPGAAPPGAAPPVSYTHLTLPTKA